MLGQIPEVLLEQIISYLSIDDWAKIDSLLFNHELRFRYPAFREKSAYLSYL
jgi:hypothetical protein